VFFERKRMLKKEAAGWEGPAAENFMRIYQTLDQ
jgi:hypothetical protein